MLSLSIKKGEYWSENGCKKKALILVKNSPFNRTLQYEICNAYENCIPIVVKSVILNILSMVDELIIRLKYTYGCLNRFHSSAKTFAD